MISIMYIGIFRQLIRRKISIIFIVVRSREKSF
nr:MAG TPA: hypothetical protein [Bacteriophage sp.]